MAQLVSARLVEAEHYNYLIWTDAPVSLPGEAYFLPRGVSPNCQSRRVYARRSEYNTGIAITYINSRLL